MNRSALAYFVAGDLLSRSNSYLGLAGLQPARAGAAALREGRGPAQARQGLPTRLLFLSDPFKNYSLQIPGQLGEEKPGGRRTEEGCSGATLGLPDPAGLRSDPQRLPARAELQWPLQEASVSARRSGSTAPAVIPGPPSSGERAMGGC